MDFMGLSVGDINGDNVDDLLIGDRFGGSYNSLVGASSPVYVVFGAD